MTRPVLPGATLGVFGSGQLGRMFAMAARRMGYRVHTFSPGEDTPTGQIADVEITASYDDLDAIRRFASGVDVITMEFENVSTEACDAAADLVPVRPSGHALFLTQQRAREKSFLALKGIPVTPFAAVASLDELIEALPRIGTPAILKTAAFGYDGKGQCRITHTDEADTAWDRIGRQAAVLERVVDFVAEFSVVAARGLDGTTVHYGAVENTHRHHILDLSVAPARIPSEAAADAVAMAQAILEELEYVGVLCVECFLTSDGRVLVNEVAPRPHNSGHYTIEACATSQFEQQVRAMCGLPLGPTTQHRPAAMANLLGDLWHAGEPDWSSALSIPGVSLHLYGKTEARPGRKMGHLTAVADTPALAVDRVLAARDVLA